MTIQFSTYQIHILSNQNIKFDVDCSQFPIFQHNQQMLATWGGGGGYTLFINHLGMCCPKVWAFLVWIAHFGLELGMVFEETKEPFESIYRFNSKWIRKK